MIKQRGLILNHPWRLIELHGLALLLQIYFL